MQVRRAPDGVEALVVGVGHGCQRLLGQVAGEEGLQVLRQLPPAGRPPQHVQPLREQPVLHHLCAPCVGSHPAERVSASKDANFDGEILGLLADLAGPIH